MKSLSTECANLELLLNSFLTAETFIPAQTKDDLAQFLSVAMGTES